MFPNPEDAEDALRGYADMPLRREGRLMKEQDRKLIEKLVFLLERMNLAQYVRHISRPGRMLWTNLLYGMLRGVGFSFGFSVLGAVMLAVLRRLLMANIPGIGSFIAEVIRAIENRI